MNAAPGIPASPSGWRHWTIWGWCVVVRRYATMRAAAEVYDPHGRLVATAPNWRRAMAWALRQR